MFGLALLDELLGLSLEEEKPRHSGLAWTKTDGQGACSLDECSVTNLGSRLRKKREDGIPWTQTEQVNKRRVRDNNYITHHGPCPYMNYLPTDDMQHIVPRIMM
jgi:hypothetical protein